MTVRVEMESLYCEPGNHKWQRPKTRGRKPYACPEHKAVTVPAAKSGNLIDPSAGIMMRVLHCAIGNHDWSRPAQRGRVPDNCPEHKPQPTISIVKVNRNSAGSVDTETALTNTLHCQAGNHDWERPLTRGRKPANCPAHSTTPGPRTVPVRVISDSFPLAEIPEDELPLVEVEGEYESETTEQEQRDLLNAAFNPAPVVKRGPGRPRVHETPEEAAEAALKRSREKVDALEANLKAHGTHISQQAPYSLYKLVRGTVAEGTAEYQFVRMFSPLAKAQFINEFSDRFESEFYYFTKEGERVDE